MERTKTLPEPCVACIDGKYIFIPKEGEPNINITEKLLSITFFDGKLPNGTTSLVANYDNFKDIESDEYIDSLGVLADALADIAVAMKVTFCHNMMMRIKAKENPTGEDVAAFTALMVLSTSLIEMRKLKG